MRTLKFAIAALVLALSVEAANAQVRIAVNIGTPPPPRRVVVVRPPVHREVVVRHIPPSRVMYRPMHRKVYYHPMAHRDMRAIRHR